MRNLLSNLNIKQKIILIPVFATIGFMISLGVISYYGDINEAILHEIEDVLVPALELTYKLDFKLTSIQRGFQDAVSAAEPEELKLTDALQREFSKVLNDASKNELLQEMLEESLQSQFESYYLTTKATTLRMIAGETGVEILAAMQHMTEEYREISGKFKANRQKLQEKVHEFHRTTHQNNKKTRLIMVAIVSLFALLLIAISTITIKSIIRPLRQAVKGAENIASGNYETRVGIDSKDEIGVLGQALDHMVDRIVDAISKKDDAIKVATHARNETQSYAERLEQSVENLEKSEKKVKASLKEKEILLKEIHHRVKNNMQVISSLLNLQSTKIKDEKTFTLFQESENRIKSMALVHERLYQTQDLATIDFADYVQNLTNNLMSSYSLQSQKARLHLNVGKSPLSIDTVIPCGLIINELISNAFKYAFPDDRAGEIFVDFHLQQNSLSRDTNNGVDLNDKFLLTVRDTGVGFPEDVDIHKSKSLGLKLVNKLVKQLKGTLEINNNDGAHFKIELYEINKSTIRRKNKIREVNPEPVVPIM